MNITAGGPMISPVAAGSGEPSAGHALHRAGPVLRLPRVRFSVRQMMIAVALLAFALWPIHHWLRRPYYEQRTKIHGLMADLCENDAKLMTGRAEACMARANRGAAWDDPCAEADILKCCPYPGDGPREGSWSEQSAVWARAARKSMRAAHWHSRMRDYYDGWSPIAPPGR